jgi:membrane protease YdiL (CAAX protease family)
MILLSLSGVLLEMSVDSSPDDLFFTAMLLQLFVYVTPAAFYCKFRDIDFIKASGARLMPVSDIPFIVSAFALYIFGMMVLIYMGVTPSDSAEITTALSSVPQTDSIFVTLCYIVIPAIAEEMLFRSVLLREYSSCKGVWAVVITAIFFAMLHFSFRAFPLYLWGGLVFGLITYVTGSSLPAVALHMISNFAAVNFSGSLSSFLRDVENSVLLIFLMSSLFVLSLYFTVACLQAIYERKADEYEDGTLAGSRADAIQRLARAGKVDKKRRNESVYEKNNSRDMFLSPTVLLAVFVFVFITLGVV